MSDSVCSATTIKCAIGFCFSFLPTVQHNEGLENNILRFHFLVLQIASYIHLSHDTTKRVFESFRPARHKPACATTEASKSLEISAIESRDIVLSKQQITKALIRLLIYAFVVRIWYKTRFWPGSNFIISNESKDLFKCSNEVQQRLYLIWRQSHFIVEFGTCVHCQKGKGFADGENYK